MLITKGSTLQWTHGTVQSCCAHRSTGAAIEIDDHATAAVLINVDIVDSMCDITSTCEKQRAHALRKFVCASEEKILYTSSIDVCTVPTKSALQEGVLFLDGSDTGSRYPTHKRDCSETADKAVGIRVTGNPVGDIFQNGEMAGGKSPFGQRGSQVIMTRNPINDVADIVARSKAEKRYQFSPRNAHVDLGRQIRKIDDGPQIDNGPQRYEHAFEIEIPQRLQGETTNGQLVFRSPADLYLRVAHATVRFKIWVRCSLDFSAHLGLQSLGYGDQRSGTYRNWDTFTANGASHGKLTPVNDGIKYDACTSEWYEYKMDFDATNAILQSIEIVIKPPLSQKLGKLSYSGLSMEIIEAVGYKQPSLHCHGCRFTQHGVPQDMQTDNVIGSGKNQIHLIDTQLSQMFIEPHVGTNTASADVSIGSRVWLKSAPENLIDNGWFAFGQHAMGIVSTSGHCDYPPNYCNRPQSETMHTEDIDGDGILDKICKRSNGKSGSISGDNCVECWGNTCPTSSLLRDGVTLDTNGATKFQHVEGTNFRNRLLNFMPRSSGGVSQYQVKGNLAQLSKRLHVCAWVRVSSGFDGVARLFAWNVSNSNSGASGVSNLDDDTSSIAQGLGPFASANRGKWMHHCKIIKLDQPINTYSLLFGHPGQHTAGSLLMTGLSLEDAVSFFSFSVLVCPLKIKTHATSIPEILLFNSFPTGYQQQHCRLGRFVSGKRNVVHVARAQPSPHISFHVEIQSNNEIF